MDALTFLRNDHESVLEMLDALDGAGEVSDAQAGGLDAMVTTLIIAESQHEAIEEQWFWPAVRNALDDGDELADHGTAQEQAGKALLQRLEDGTPGEADYHDALQKFVQAGREHIAYEQDVVWPRIAAALSQADLDKIGERLETAKKVAPTRPHPATPPVGMVQKTMGLGVAVADHVRDAVTGRGAHTPPDPQTH
jgi:hemerythrin-like domain-containing protein